MANKKQKYIITLLVDNREWNSQPIQGELGDLQSIIDEALEQHRISRFFTIRQELTQKCIRRMLQNSSKLLKLSKQSL